MDAACLPALAVIGRAALPPSLAERYRLLERGELDDAAADEVRGQLDELAGVLAGYAGASRARAPGCLLTLAPPGAGFSLPGRLTVGAKGDSI